jgi:hypothetical protein
MFASRDGLVGYHAESWFVAREKDGKITFAKSGSYRTTSDAHLYHELPGGDVLIGAYNGLFAIRPSADDPVLTKIDDHDTGYIAMLREISGQRVFADTRRGLFIVREESGKVRTTPAAMDGVSTGRILEQPRYPGHVLIELPDGTVVFGGEGGLFAGVPKACAGK